jgi:hypothetical protein
MEEITIIVDTEEMLPRQLGQLSLLQYGVENL